MLVYEREIKNPIKKVLTTEEINALKPEDAKQSTKEETIGEIYNNNKEYYTYNDFYNVDIQLPLSLITPIKKDNDTFLLEQHIYSNTFFTFIDNLLSIPLQNMEIEILRTEIAIKVIFSIISRAHCNKSIESLGEKLIELTKKSNVVLKCLLEFVGEKFEDIMHVLLKCPSKNVRTSIGYIMRSVLLLTIKDTSKKLTRTCGISILNSMMSIINKELTINYYNSEQYFEILLSIFKEGEEEVKKLMNSKDIVKELISFYLNKTNSHFTRNDIRSQEILSNSIVDLICITISYANLSFIQPENIRNDFSMPLVLYELSESSISSLINKEFISKVIMNSHTTSAFAQLIAFFCFNGEKYSKFIAKTILKGINNDITQRANHYFIVINALLTIKDSLQQQRIEWLLGIHNIIETDINPKSVYLSALGYKSSYRSLLDMYWRQEVNEENLISLLSLILNVPEVLNYVVNNCYKLKMSFNSERKEVKELLSKIQEQCKKSHIPTNYIIGIMMGEKIIVEENKGNVKLLVTELITECTDEKISTEAAILKFMIMNSKFLY